MKMHHPAFTPNPEDHPKVRVRWIRDTYGTGFGGFGYGGTDLYCASLVDCFDPPLYVFRADSFADAIETADECLSTPFDGLETERDDTFVTSSPAGREIWADQDVRVWKMSR